MARCPAHEDRKPSLSISSGRDGKVLVRCHAGCDQRDVIAILRRRGLWETTRKSWGRFARKRQDRVSDEPDADAHKRSEAALAIWQASQPAEGTTVAAYLRSRGLVLPGARQPKPHVANVIPRSRAARTPTVETKADSDGLYIPASLVRRPAP